jgi:PAS domain-containing protein
MQTREVIRTIEALHRYIEELRRQMARGVVRSEESLSQLLTAMQQALVTLRAAATQRPRRRAGVARRKGNDEFAQPAANPVAELHHMKAALEEEIRHRKEAETALQESRNLLAAFADSIPDSFFVKNTQGQYEVINARGACFFGTSIEEVIGKADTELLPAPVAHRIREEDLAVTTTGQVQTYEDTFLMEEGT